MHTSAAHQQINIISNEMAASELWVSANSSFSLSLSLPRTINTRGFSLYNITHTHTHTLEISRPTRKLSSSSSRETRKHGFALCAHYICIYPRARKRHRSLNFAHCRVYGRHTRGRRTDYSVLGVLYWWWWWWWWWAKVTPCVLYYILVRL